MAQIDEKYLKGLTFKGAEEKEVIENGKKRKKWFPFTRPLEPGDVMGWSDKGKAVVISTKDGRKHIVDKTGKKPEPTKEPETDRGEKK